jgi:hypothetical protein
VFWSAVTTVKYTVRLSCFFLVYYSSSTVVFLIQAKACTETSIREGTRCN